MRARTSPPAAEGDIRPGWLFLTLLPALLPPGGALTQEGGPTCTLRWESLTDSTESRSIEEQPEQYRHHVWNGMRWTCGDAVMTADSAVQYPGRRVEMVGSVHYRDTIRDLDARRLTYHQSNDLIEARDSVHLVRRATGSTLRAPSVDFYRSGSGEIRQTVARGGVRIQGHPATDTAGDDRSFDITSNSAIILPGDVTIARDNVVITREDLRGTGEFGRFAPDEGTSLLTGDPILVGNDYRLTGDTIRTASSDGILREVRATGAGHLESQGLDVRGPEIRIAVRQDTVRTLWAYGGDARSRSSDRLLLGDSLYISFRGGRPDSATSVGRAAAVELAGGEIPELSPRDTAREPAAETPVTDTVASDTLPAVEPPETDSIPAEESPEADTLPAEEPPEGLFTLERDWIRGDTVRALFTSDRRSSTPDSSRDAETPGSGDGVALRELRATGSARAYYRVVRDTARDRPGRNYVLGSVITVVFREGEPHRVTGTQAIGVFLEPAGPGGASIPGPADTTVRPDTLPAADTTVIPDSLSRDTTAREGQRGVPIRSAPEVRP